VEGDGSANLNQHLIARAACGDAAWQVWNMRTEVALGFFDDNGIARSHGRQRNGRGSGEPQAGLSGDALQRARGEIVTGLSRNRNATWLLRMLELPVAAAGRDQLPASVGEPSDHLANLHGLNATQIVLSSASGV
jgi:hypothetical protein